MKVRNALIALALLLPALTIAATTDFTANSDMTVSSVTFGSGTADMLILNGSTAESWQFSSGTFSVTNPGTFKVGSSDSSVKSIQFSSGGTTLICSENTTPGTSFATAPTAAGTYTVTPSATTQCTSLCSAVSNAASYNSFPTCGAASCNAGYTLAGSGASATCVAIGGGGPPELVGSCGIGYTLSGGLCYPNKVSTNANARTATNPATASHGAVSAIFEHTLRQGMDTPEVKRLQKLLAGDTSLYPEGMVTGYFGPLTEKAVQRFQAKYGIVSSGTPETTGFGFVGPKTRAKLNALLSR